MPDTFFASTKNRKRKRATTRDAGPSTSRGGARGGGKQTGHKQASKPKTSKRTADEELSDDGLSDETPDDNGREGIDDMDLSAPDVDPDAYESAQEDEDETPASAGEAVPRQCKRGPVFGCVVCLLTRRTCFDWLAAEGEFDAAEIDRELISARLKQEHPGKVHLFVADKVRLLFPFIALSSLILR